MKRIIVLITVLFVILLQSCTSISDMELDECKREQTETIQAGSVGHGFIVLPHGRLIDDPKFVISGSASLLAENFDLDSMYNQYLILDPQIFRFDPQGVYTIKFDYRILSVSPEGDSNFETVMFSSLGGAEEKWISSLNLTSPVDTRETAEFTFHLLEFPDYELSWNVTRTGSIVIDNIEVYNSHGILVAYENFESPTVQTAQVFLPTARVGQPYFCIPAVYGTGMKPIKVLPTGANLPPGLSVNAEGQVEGIPQQEGDYTVSLIYSDSVGTLSHLAYNLSVVPENEISEYRVVGRKTNLPNQIAYSYEPYYEPFRNPLKGIRDDASSVKNHPWSTLGRQYIEWNTIERDSCDTVEHIKQVTDEVAAGVNLYNVKIIPRVYLRWPPDGNYWPKDLKSGDYYSKEFKERLFKLIQKMGEAWDEDPRVAYIEMGLIGDWGEHHDPGFGNLGFEEAHPVPYEDEFAQAFYEAFPHKHVMHRYPRDFKGYPFGLHWDTFGGYDNGYYATDSDAMTQELLKPEHVNAWKIAPRGGEIDPTFLGYPSWDSESFYLLIKEHDQRLISLIKELHWNHLAFLNDFPEENSEVWEKAAAIHNELGYTFVIDEAKISSYLWQSEFTISINLSNTGSSPFYYDWPLQIVLLDPDTHRVLWKSLWEGVDICSWLPNETYTYEQTFEVPWLPDGEYLVALAILDPSGMTPAVRFANKNYFNGGYTPLGRIGIGRSLEDYSFNGFDDLAGDRSLYYLPSTD